MQINWYGYGLQRGIISCKDVFTAKFVKEAASNFEVRGQKFRGWFKNEYGDLKKTVIGSSNLMKKHMKPVPMTDKDPVTTISKFNLCIFANL